MTFAQGLDLLMFAVACVLLLLGFPVAFTLAGTALIFALIGAGFGVFDFGYLGALPLRAFQNMTNETLIAVPLFIFMGVMLERSKVAEELLDSMGRCFGQLRGGLGISVSIVGALLAASTGIVGATVVTMGLLSLPTMLRRGYEPSLACGSICAAGTLGQIIPPSIVLVLLGDVMSSAYQEAQLKMGIFSADTISVGDLFAGSLLPGLGLVFLYILYQIGMAIFRPETSPPIPAEELAPGTTKGSVFFTLAHALIPPIVLIVSVLGSILGGFATPTEAAAVGAVGSIMLAGLRVGTGKGTTIYVGAGALIAVLFLTANVDLRLNTESGSTAGIVVAAILTLLVGVGLFSALYAVYKVKVLTEVMRSTTRITAMVFLILVGAAMFSLVFRGLGGDDAVHQFLHSMPGGKVGAMITVMGVIFVLGFFLDFIEITFVVVPIVAPVLMQMGINPVWLGVMIAMNLQTSFLTPPFGFALFYLRGVAPDSVSTMQIYKGIIPFVIIQILALIILTFIPSLATWLPTVIFHN